MKLSDEIGDLAAAFGSMAADLNHQQQNGPEGPPCAERCVRC